MSVIHVNKESFAKCVSKGVVVVDFWAPWCGPCRAMSPVLEEFANKHTDCLVCKVNVDEEEELAEEFMIASIPTLMIFKDGKLVNKSVGSRSLADLEKLVF